jgi:hypothetical protein
VSAEMQGRFIAHWIFGDEEWGTPQGTKAWTYFAKLPTTVRWQQARYFYYELNEGQRARKLINRMGEDQ